MEHSSPPLAVEAAGLTKRFGDTKAVNGVDLAVPKGSVTGVLGPNGAGKTTVVRILTTLLRPDSGTAWVGGYDVSRHALQVRQLIGVTGQYASVDEDLTGTQNLVMVARLLGLKRAQSRKRAAELLEQAGLSHAAHRAAKTYSGACVAAWIWPPVSSIIRRCSFWTNRPQGSTRRPGLTPGTWFAL